MRQISYDLLPLGSIKIPAWYLALWVGLPPGCGALTPLIGCGTAVGAWSLCSRGFGVGTRKIRRCSVKTNSWPRWLPRWMPFLPAPVPRRPLNPKVAAHGDFALHGCHATGQAPQAQPRALGEQLKATLEATPAYQRWVDAIEIAGPGFLNIRLKPCCQAGSGA